MGSIISERYEIGDRVGAGSTGDVYAALDLRLRRSVAIKIAREPVLDEDLRRRFTNEARRVAKLQHPNIATVLDAGDFEDRPFIVFEYIHGRTVRELLVNQSTVPLVTKLEYMQQLCAALLYVHRQDPPVVHLDIKPENLMVEWRDHFGCSTTCHKGGQR